MDQRVVALFSFLFVVNVFAYPRCLLFDKKCVSHCPRNMHPYNTRCDRDTLSQRTCNAPFVYNLGYTCGWSRCDCNGDLLLDEVTMTCITFQQCELSLKEKPRRRKKNKPFRLSKKLRLQEEDDLANPFT